MKNLRPLFLSIFAALAAVTPLSTAGPKPAAVSSAASLVFQRGSVDEQYGFGGSLYMLDPIAPGTPYFFGGGNHPNYSLDGTQIVFSDTDGYISKTPADNYTSTNLVFAGGGSPLNGLKPKWSPDSTLIAFETNVTNANKIVITNATCTSGNEYNTDVCNYTKLDGTSTAVSSDPSWYPTFDSNSTTRAGRVIFVRKASSSATTGDIYATDLFIDPNGVAHEAQTVNLTQGLASYEAPSYSHDGTKIIFVENGSLHLMDADGFNQYPIVSSVNSGLIYGSDPAFSPGDSKITWGGSEGIYSADLVINSNNSVSANNITSLTTTNADRSPSWTGEDSPEPVAPPHGGLSATKLTVNEKTTPSTSVNDTVLRFRAIQKGTPAGLLVRIQANSGSGWDFLPDGLQGQMAYVPQVTGYILNSTNYPTGSSVSFRAVSTGAGYPQSISNVVGPFDLTQNRPHLGPTLLFVTTNGEVNAIRFGVKETTVPAGIFVRVQTTQTPAVEDSWSDATIGNTSIMNQDPADPNQFYLGTDNYPDGEGIYFRAVASDPNGNGYVNSISIPYGPFKFVTDPPASVTLKLNGESIPPNDIDSGQLVPAGGFNVAARASSGRPIKRLAILIDGSLIDDFASDNAAVDYNTSISGDHLIEAYATDDLGVTGAAVPIHIRILPAAPARAFTMQNSGDWNQASNWIDIDGNSGVPGPNDFAIVGTYSPTISTDVSVGALSLNGGTLNGTHTLTVNHFCTIADGAIKSNLTIVAGAICELLNDHDITLTGTFTYAGSVRLHGKGGIGGVNKPTNQATFAGPHPDGLFDFVGGIIHGLGQFIVDLAAGGKRGSKATPAPAPAVAAPEKRMVKAAEVQIPAGKVTVVPPPAVAAGVISSDSAGIVSHDSGGLVAQGGGNLVAQGAGNLVPPASLISQDGGGLVQGGGNVVATLITQDGGGLISQDGGGVVATGSNSTSAAQRSAEAPAADTAPISISGGELDLNGLIIYGDVAMDGGVLSGSGIIVGNLTNSGGFISPGHSPGAIAVEGSYTQGANGTLVVENGGPSPNQFDQLSVAGAVALDGKLDVKLINGYTPDVADTYSPLSYASVTGQFASVTSNASITVNESGLLVSTDPSKPNPIIGQPINISTRGQVFTGDNVMIAGFILAGTTPKNVVIRAIGPSLTKYSLDGLLADPVLTLYDAHQQPVTTNDNWRINDETGKSQAASVPPNLQPTNDAESVIVITLQPNTLYTAIVRGKNDTTGLALVEVYDVDPSDTSRFTNISTRGVVGTGDNVLIGGFIVAPNGPAKVLVRAIGPSLGAFGLSGLLQDPTLGLYDANGNEIMTNDDWNTDQAAEIQAANRAPNDPHESALIATLAPGNYTAIVRGKNNTTGMALVEIYDIQQ